MNKNTPFATLIENVIQKLNLKGLGLTVHISTTSFSHQFAVYDGDLPIFIKDIPVLDSEQDAENMYYEVARDLISGTIEKLLDQKKKGMELFLKQEKVTNEL